MLTEFASGWTKVVTSLKVAAMVTVLGAVVLAATPRTVTEIAPKQAVATDTASTLPASTPDGAAQPAATDYFPAHFPAPSGPVAEQPPSF